MKTIGERIKNILRTIVLFGYAPVSCLAVLVFYLRHRRVIRDHDVIFPFWIWAFGHQVIGWELMRRLFATSRVLVIAMPHPRTNSFVPRLYQRNGLNVLSWHSPLGSWRPDLIGPMDEFVFKITLLIDVWRRQATLIHSIQDLYKIGRPVARLLQGNFGGTGLQEGTNLTAFMRWLKEPFPSLRFPEDIEHAIVTTIRRRHPDFDNRFVALHVRGHRGDDLSQTIREVKDASRYRAAVARLIEEGLWVLVGGAVERRWFADLKRVIFVDEIDYDKAALNVYALSRCLFFIGNQCGTHVLPNIMQRPCLIVDAMPYNLGTFHEQDLVMFKEIHTKDGRALRLEEIYQNEPAFGHDLESRGLILVENDPQDIKAAVEEMLEIVRGRLRLSEEDQQRIRRFRALLKPTMSIYHAGNRPPLAYLKKFMNPEEPQNKIRAATALKTTSV